MYQSIKPRVFSFWFGGEMSPDRLQCYRQIEQIFTKENIEHILITHENLATFVPEENPLHPAFPYLSDTHKSDYLRCYFMHFFGGGYTDIKTPQEGWRIAFDRVAYQPHIYISGFRESEEGHIAPVKDPHMRNLLRTNFRDLVGTCNFICKPQTPFTTQWFEEVTRILNQKLPLLMQYPGRHPREGSHDGADPHYPYPIEWTEILGNVFHPLVYHFKDNVDYSCPRFVDKPYR